MIYKIKAPNGGYCGETAGIKFADGLGETDDEQVVSYLKEKGYEVTTEEVKDKPKKKEKEDSDGA
nr:MAG TPA: Poliovirus 3A protein like [Caudoviricetes sp.]